ncbi:galactose-1-phosphate uridylyltransferase [Spirochaetota bacterium]
MSEFRQNITTGEWVIIATERAKRPADFTKRSGKRVNLTSHDDACPFCKNGKAEKEKPIYQLSGKKGWELRVLHNKYAALQKKAKPARVQDGMYVKAGGYGSAEVLIETPRHDLTIATMKQKTVEAVVNTYRLRYREIAKDRDINFINIFRNYGEAAGASLVHPHSQIIASLVAPPHVSDQIFYARNHCNTWGACVYCEMIAYERKQKKRIVFESDHHIALCPYASRSPFEVRIYPKRHSSVFGNITENESCDLAYILRNVLGKIYRLLDDPDYNYIIRSITTNDGEVQFYHWYLVIIPKLRKIAGFEMGTGIYINVSEPEASALQLSSVKVTDL